MWPKLKKFFWQTRGIWITAPGIAGLVILLRLTGLLQSWEWEAYDLYMRWRPQEPTDERIAIVGIDENDLGSMQSSIITDSIVAALLEKLKAMQPRAIGLDLYRDLPVPPGTKSLDKVFASTPNLVGIQKVAGESGRETVAPPPILKAKEQVGANDIITDADNRVRRGFLYLSNKDETVYSFSLHLAGHYLEKEGITPQIIEGSDNWQIGKAVFSPFAANDGGYVRTDAGGFQTLINYRGGSKHFETVSMTDVLEGRLPQDWGRDRIILIGKVSESFKDVVFTPYSDTWLGSSQYIPGVEIHANLTSQIIQAALDGRPLMKTWSDSLEWLWILLWSGVGATLSWQLRYADGVRSLSWRKWVSFLIAGSGSFGITYLAFLNGWWLPLIPPVLALTGSAAVITAYMARSAIQMRKTFGRYLTDQVVANLMEHPDASKLGGERRRITILTSDLRGFTATCERLPPEEVVRILNFYLGYMADVITKHLGTIDEFMGDGILVLFGAPTIKEDDAQRAIACAIEMQLAMNSVNAQMKAWDLPNLEMGIGINTGEVVVGNIGSEKRTKYGVIGSQVNLTYRIESYTTGGQILISESTLKAAGSSVSLDGQKEVLPKGVKNPLTIYEVSGISGNYNLFLSKEEEIFLPLPEVIPIQYSVLEGKSVGDALIRGNIVQLSARGAEICSNQNLQQEIPIGWTNIKLNFLTPNQAVKISEDVYAKVLEKTSQNGNFYIYFTAKPPAIAKQLDALYEKIKG